MKVLILGASGLVGGNCLRYFNSRENTVAAGTHLSFATENTHAFNTLHLSDPANFDIAGFNPDIIVHCGALTWVDYCEQHPEESREKTVISTENVISLCKELNAKIVYISTDYVFDGDDGPYTEEAPVSPKSIYGKHKLEAEELIRASKLDHLILRITNVYGDEIRNKNFIARLLDLIASGKAKHLTLPCDQYATPVNALDVAKAAHLLLRDNKNGLYHIASTDYVNRVQLANRVLKYFSEHEISITPATTTSIDPPAPRPLFGGMISAKFLKEYPDFEFSNADDYLRKKVGK